MVEEDGEENFIEKKVKINNYYENFLKLCPMEYYFILRVMTFDKEILDNIFTVKLLDKIRFQGWDIYFINES